MDIVSLLFYRSWLNAVRAEGRGKTSDPDRLHHAIPDGPNWRLVLSPMALVAALVLAGILLPAGT